MAGMQVVTRMVDRQLRARLTARLRAGFVSLMGLRLGLCVIADAAGRRQGHPPV